MKIKHFFQLIFLLILIFSLAACEGPGVRQDGSPEYPYLINNTGALASIGTGSYNMDSHYRLTEGITLSGDWEPIGTKDNPFNGVIDCYGKEIGMAELQGDNEEYYGIFAYIGEDGVVKNLKLAGDLYGNDSQYVGYIAGFNAGTIYNIKHEGQVSGNNVVGGIAGKNTGNIKRIYRNGNTTGNGENSIAGGIAGINIGGSIIEAEASGQVLGTFSTDAATEDGGIGGIVGFSENGDFSNNVINSTVITKAKDEVYEAKNIGGLIGYSRNDIIKNSYRYHPSIILRDNNVYNLGLSIGKAEDTEIENTYVFGYYNNISQGTNVGQFIGYANNNIVNNMKNNYVLKTDEMEDYYIGNIDNNDYIHLNLIEEISNQEEYIGFDFEEVWTFDKEGAGGHIFWDSPILQWQTETDWWL